MEQTDILALKIDALIEAIRNSTDLGRQTLDEVKRINSAIEIQVGYLKDEDKRIWETLEDFRTSRKKIYERLEKLEVEFVKTNGGYADRNGISKETFETQAKAFIHSTLGHIVIWGAMLAIGALISKVCRGGRKWGGLRPSLFLVLL